MNKLNLPSPLVSVEWLATHLDHPDLIILDATLPKVGQKGLSDEASTTRIPRARFFDLKNTFRDLEAKLPNTMLSPEKFTEAAQQLGINTESVIVIYDHHGIYSSPRAWWVLQTMGHKNVAILDGGFSAWKNAQLPIVDKTIYAGSKGNFIANYQAQLLTDAQGVLNAIGQEDSLILDARSAGRFHGTEPEPRASLRGGHIPSSKNLPISKIIKDGKMLPTAALKEIYHELEVGDKKLIFSCGSGVTACVIAFGAELAGHKNKSVYDGSWTEWGDYDA